MLIILTDGVLDDFEALKDEIIICSELPISIIIVGLGEGNFSLLEE